MGKVGTSGIGKHGQLSPTPPATVLRHGARHVYPARRGPGDKRTAGRRPDRRSRRGVHELSIAGADEDEAATGDLDVTDDLTIAGANAYLSIVDANGVDRVMDQLAAAGLRLT